MESISILIVEDSEAQRKMVASMCQDMGIDEIVEAENGRVAIDIINAKSIDFDILICDLEMPDIDGIELINLLGANQTNSALVILSGREKSLISSVEFMATKKGLWVLGGLQKPLTSDALQELFNNFLTYRNEQGQVIRPNIKPNLMPEEIKSAINKNQVELHYQPKINMKDQTLSGVECLVRIRKDERIVFPDQFIDVCEESDLIDELSYTIVRLAIEARERWNTAGLNVKWSINLSAVSFDNSQFCDALINIIKTIDGNADQLIFEVTETAVIQDIGKALSVLNRLRLAGCGLSLDDYGTGYSSIQQLSQIPFTEVKMDRSLIDGISSKPHLQVIFESTLTMCNKLELSMVAEGIEKHEDWLYLKQKGCHIAQGYYYAPPMQEQAFLDWYRSGMSPLG